MNLLVMADHTSMSSRGTTLLWASRGGAPSSSSSRPKRTLEEVFPPFGADEGLYAPLKGSKLSPKGIFSFSLSRSTLSFFWKRKEKKRRREREETPRGERKKERKKANPQVVYQKFRL